MLFPEQFQILQLGNAIGDARHSIVAQVEPPQVLQLGNAVGDARDLIVGQV